MNLVWPFSENILSMGHLIKNIWEENRLQIHFEHMYMYVIPRILSIFSSDIQFPLLRRFCNVRHSPQALYCSPPSLSKICTGEVKASSFTLAWGQKSWYCWKHPLYPIHFREFTCFGVVYIKYSSSQLNCGHKVPILQRVCYCCEETLWPCKLL